MSATDLECPSRAPRWRWLLFCVAFDAAIRLERRAATRWLSRPLNRLWTWALDARWYDGGRAP